MKYREGKVRAAKPVSHADGPTSTINDPAKFPNKGKSGKGKYENGVIDQKEGATFTCNETLIPTPNANRPAPMSKLIKADKDRVSISEHETTGDLTVSQTGSGGPTDRPYPLAKSYEKKGRGDATEPKRGER